MKISIQKIQLGRLLGGIVVALAIHGTSTQAQPVIDWVKVSGTALSEYFYGLVRGPGEELLLAGSFGVENGFPTESALITLDGKGNEISRQPWRGADIHAVVVDPKGGYYLTGSVRNPSLLGIGQKEDFYLAKHAADGALLWERTGGTTRTENRTPQADGQCGNAILLDAQGNVLVAGRSQGPAVYDNVALSDTLGGPIICKYSPDGALLWIRRVEGSRRFEFDTWIGYGWADTMLLDANGNIVISGTMTDGRADFGGTVVTINGYWDYGPFTAKYSPSGDVLWVRTAGAAGAIDRHGNVYASDAYYGNKGWVNSQYKYDPMGSLIWQRTLLGVWLKPAAVDAKDEPIYIGKFEGIVQLDGHSLENDTPERESGVVGKADAKGKFRWIISGKSGGLDSIISRVVCDPSGGIWVAGSVQCAWSDGGPICDGTGSFGSFPLSIQMGGSSDFFLAHLTDPSAVAVELKIARTITGLVLSWPASAAGFILESADSPSASSWTTVTNASAVVGDQNVVAVESGSGSKFFRLRK